MVCLCFFCLLMGQAIIAPHIQTAIFLFSYYYHLVFTQVKMNWQIDINSYQYLDQEKKLYQSLDSLSPTPSPTLLNNYPQLPQTINSIIDLSAQRHTQNAFKGGKKSRKISEQVKSINRGHWSTQQNKKYHWFLQMHYKHFVNRHLRRMDKIFKSMQTFVGTRQAQQCRSHHQKMQKKYHNFITIISNLRNLHYNSLHPQPILEEITSASIYPPDGIATIKELQEQQIYLPVLLDCRQKKKSQSAAPAIKQQLKEAEKIQVDQKRIQQQKQQQQNLNANILDQSNLNMGQLILYHDKDDHSCLFNSLLANDL